MNERTMRVLTGRCGAPGFAEGPLIRLPRLSAVTARPVRSVAEEAAAFADARRSVGRRLAALMDTVDSQTAAGLEAQAALLADTDLAAAVEAAIADGLSARDAWDAYISARRAGASAAAVADITDLSARIEAHLGGSAPSPAVPAAGIVLADDMTPAILLDLGLTDRHGIALAGATPASHAAILARQRGIPLLCGIGPLPDGQDGLLDAGGGRLIIDPDAEARAAFAAVRRVAETAPATAELHLRTPAATLDGEPVQVCITIDRPEDIVGLDPAICDGVGLVRTEFLLAGPTGDIWSDDAAQTAAYDQIVHWAAGRRVAIRTLDAGADKPVAGWPMADEANPALGLRGVRWALAHPHLLRCQLRALLRAARLGPLDILVPMVTLPGEMAAVRALLQEERLSLQDAGIAIGTPRLGMMVEVPAAALTLDAFDMDVVAIGTGDLTQYVMAAGRDCASVAALHDATSPAVLRLIEHVVAVCAERGLPLSLCGPAAGDPAALPYLLDCGLRALVVAPADVGRVKQAIRRWSASGDAG